MAATSPKKRAQAKAFYEAQTPEERRAYRRGWKLDHPEAAREIRLRYEAKLRLDVILAYGGACACCGIDYLPHLTLDHIDGGGAEERRLLRGRGIYRRLRREGYPPGYQVLCWNCNSAKHHLGRCGCQEVLA